MILYKDAAVGATVEVTNKGKGKIVEFSNLLDEYKVLFEDGTTLDFDMYDGHCTTYFMKFKLEKTTWRNELKMIWFIHRR